MMEVSGPLIREGANVGRHRPIATLPGLGKAVSIEGADPLRSDPRQPIHHSAPSLRAQGIARNAVTPREFTEAIADALSLSGLERHEAKKMVVTRLAARLAEVKRGENDPFAPMAASESPRAYAPRSAERQDWLAVIHMLMVQVAYAPKQLSRLADAAMESSSHNPNLRLALLGMIENAMRGKAGYEGLRDIVARTFVVTLDGFLERDKVPYEPLLWTQAAERCIDGLPDGPAKGQHRLEVQRAASAWNAFNPPREEPVGPTACRSSCP